MNRTEMNKNYMSFNNVDNIQIFDDFLKEYIDKIKEIQELNSHKYNNKNQITIISNKNQLASFILDPKGNECIACSSDGICYHEANCNNINLSKEERYAIIAHEIGHIYDETYKKKHEEREKNADLFAYKLGLKAHLISVLQKMITIEKDDRVKKDMQKRINILTDYQ